MTMCQSTKVTLCITPFSAWLAVISTEYLIQDLTERKYSLTASTVREIARNVIKKPCCIGDDYDTELKSLAETDKEKTCELPEGNISTVGAVRFRCAEELFQPSFTGEGVSGIHETSSLTKCVVDTRKKL